MEKPLSHLLLRAKSVEKILYKKTDARGILLTYYKKYTSWGELGRSENAHFIKSLVYVDNSMFNNLY